jgi:Bardet-Biedl syndrome 9 protein
MALEITVAKFSRERDSDPEIIVLAERSLFCLDGSGEIKFQKRLDYHPTSMTAYNVVEEQGTCNNMIISSHTNNLKIMREMQLIWSASVSSLPIAIAVSTFGGIFGMIATMDDKGSISVHYLGTNPSEKLVSVEPAPAELDFQEMHEELKKLKSAIKEFALSK